MGPITLLARQRPRGHRTDRGFTLIELLVVVAIISIVVAIATPGLLRARMTANETSAIASLRITAVAQVAYSSACGKNEYAETFVVLGTPLTTGGEPFLSSDLGSMVTPQKSGYNFTMDAGAGRTGTLDCLARTTNTSYYATAVPQAMFVSGNRSFAINHGNIVWQSLTATPPTEPFIATATVFPIQ